MKISATQNVLTFKTTIPNTAKPLQLISSLFKIYISVQTEPLTVCCAQLSAFIMNKHLLSNVSFPNNKGYLKLADSLHFKKNILVTVVTSTSITTDCIELCCTQFF